MRRLTERGVDLSAVHKPGAPRDEWARSFRVVAGNAFAAGMADCANGAVRAGGVGASVVDDVVAGGGGGFGLLGRLASGAVVRFALENKAPVALAAALVVVVVVAAGTVVVLWRGRRGSSGGLDGLDERGEEDDGDDGGEDDDDGDNGGGDDDRDGEQSAQIMCRVTLDNPSDGHHHRTAAKAPRRWAWGYFLPSGAEQVQVTPSGKVRYRVRLPLAGTTGWFEADRVEFVDGGRFCGHGLRERV